MNTLLLDVSTWDSTVDSFGNIAMATDPYSIAQDVASACRVFQGELWYGVTQGIPYFQQILGHFPPANFVKKQMEVTAETVPEVASAKCFLTSFVNRKLGGQIQVTTQSGLVVTAAFNEFQGVLPWYVLGASPMAVGSPAGGP